MASTTASRIECGRPGKTRSTPGKQTSSACLPISTSAACLLLRRERGKLQRQYQRRTHSLPSSLGGPYPYMMPPAASPYMPPGYYSPQQQPNPPLHPQPTPQPPGILPPASSPLGQPDTDPDELIQGYFDHLIKKYPHQQTALSRAQNLFHKKAFDVEDLWSWIQKPAQHPRLVEVAPGLRKRIKTHLKEFLQHSAPPRPQRQRTHSSISSTATTGPPITSEIDLTQTDQSSERTDSEDEEDEYGEEQGRRRGGRGSC